MDIERLTPDDRARLAKHFRDAADKRLMVFDYDYESAGRDQEIKGGRHISYTCDTLKTYDGIGSVAVRLYKLCGCPGGFFAFKEFPKGPERQAARFFCLDFIAEGIERGLI